MKEETILNLKLYTSHDYASFVSQYAEKTSSIEANLLTHDSTEFVSNISTETVVIGTDNDFWSVSINKKEYDNALIVSPYATYVKYPFDKLDKFGTLWLKIITVINSVVMGVLCKITRINQIVQVNNNLNSLLKHPKKFNPLLPQLTKLLIRKYPHHAITYFRVNDHLNKDLLKTLRNNGYILFPDRMAHVFFPEKNFIKRSHTKRDISLLRKTNYQVVQHDQLLEADADQIAELYRKLFVEKHSKFNPVYTKAYFRQAIKNKWHHYVALRNPNGQIDAFISWFCKEDIMICGPLGYDTSVDQKTGLYRILVALCLQHSHENQLIFNMGGGSDVFKANRGSSKTLEYTAVYCKHLPFYRHIPWRIISWACNKMLSKIYESSKM